MAIIKPMNDIKRHMVDGEMLPVMNTLYVNPNRVNIKWYDYEGNLLDENYDGRVLAHMFEVYIDGVDKCSIHTVEFPKMSYEHDGDYLVKVETVVYENGSCFKDD